MSPVVALLIPCGAIWLGVLSIRTSLLVGCLGVVLAGALVGHAFWNTSLGPVPLTFDRLALMALAGMYGLHRWLGRTERRALVRADVLLMAFIGVLILSTFTHDWSRDSYQPVMRLGLYYLTPLAVYWVVRQAPLTQAALRGVLWFLAAFGAYLAFTALAEVSGTWSLVFPRYVRDPALEFFGRGRGPMLNPVANGLYISVGMCSMLLLWREVSRLGRLWIVALLPVFFAGIYATLTRCVWLGAAAGLLLFLWLRLPRTWRGGALTALVLSGLFVVATQWDSIWTYKRDKEMSAAQAAESAKLRPVLAGLAWEMFCERPLLGFGLGQYAAEHRAYAYRPGQQQLSQGFDYAQHNVFLSLMTETGLIGCGLFALLLWTWARDARRLARDVAQSSTARDLGLLTLLMLAIYLPNAMFQDAAVIWMVNMLLFLLAAISTNLAAGSARTAASPRDAAWSLVGPQLAAR